jgi:hypothetical protein
VTKLQEERDMERAAAQELRQGLEAVQGDKTVTVLQRELADTVRRMAVVQVSAV